MMKDFLSQEFSVLHTFGGRKITDGLCSLLLYFL